MLVLLLLMLLVVLLLVLLVLVVVVLVLVLLLLLLLLLCLPAAGLTACLHSAGDGGPARQAACLHACGGVAAGLRRQRATAGLWRTDRSRDALLARADHQGLRHPRPEPLTNKMTSSS